MNPWEKYATTKPASGPWDKRKQPELPVIATTPDGGKVYRMPDNTLSFSSPGMSTNNQEAIRKIMEGATPAEGSVYGDVSEGGQIGAGVRSLIQGMMFGYGDEVVARGASLFGGSYEAEKQRERARLEKGRDNYGATSALAELGGAIAVPLGAIAPVRVGGQVASVLGPTGARVANALGTAGKSAAVTGALSAAYASGTGDGLQDRAQKAQDGGMWGAGIGALIPVGGGIAERIWNRFKANAAVKRAAANAPTTDELRAMGEAAYKAVDNAGVVIDPNAFRGAVSGITNDMRAAGMREGIGRALSPKAAELSDVMTDVATSPKFSQGVPFSEVDTLRRLAGAPASDMGNKLESALGTQAISGLDDFVNNITPAQVTQGNAADLPKLINDARDVWAKMRRSQLIDDAIENADTYLGGAASGVRNQFARILRNPKLNRGFSDAERKLMLRVVNGSIPEQLLNLVSGGIGQLASVVGGTASGGVAGGLVGAAGAGVARTAAENVALRNAERVRAIIANGGMPALPQIGQDTRAFIDALMRRGTAVASQ